MAWNLSPAMLAWLLCIIQLADAFWRLPCISPVLVERADPIINPGKPSPHLHTIMGGNGFGFSMDYAQTQASQCSTCTVQKDLSNYWIPSLWYAGENGTFTDVKQVGGATIYYLQRPGNEEKLVAFPPGLRMVAGDPTKRSYDNDKESAAISYACLNSDRAMPETHGFPETNCDNGLRAQVFFPSCWDGENLDSHDHRSHMAYPVDDATNGPCPKSHPVHFISLFYEVLFDTSAFSAIWHGEQQPFVWSSGDSTGYGLHGDFVNGWDVDHLQQAIDECTNDSGRVEDCPIFTMTPDNVAEGCRIPPSIDEATSGTLDALPGCHGVYADTAQVSSSSSSSSKACPASNEAVVGKPQAFFTDLTQTKQWSYLGCGTDDISNRQFTGNNTSSDAMTIEFCVDFCEQSGFVIAGAEFGRECYCANEIPPSAAPIEGYVGNCLVECAGDAEELCGGWGTISLYQRCDGGSGSAENDACQNVEYGGMGN